MSNYLCNVKKKKVSSVIRKGPLIVNSSKKVWFLLFYLSYFRVPKKYNCPIIHSLWELITCDPLLGPHPQVGNPYCGLIIRRYKHTFRESPWTRTCRRTPGLPPSQGSPPLWSWWLRCRFTNCSPLTAHNRFLVSVQMLIYHHCGGI